MLNHLKKHWRSWLVASLTVALFLLIAASTDAFQECMNHRYYESSDYEPPKGFAQILRLLSWTQTCSGEFLRKDGEAITAFFTLVLGISTVALWWSTRRLWEAGKEALQVTERAFVSLDRFDVELTTAADTKNPIDHAQLPSWYRGNPELCITRFAVFPRWKNSGGTPTQEMKIQVDWRGPEGPIPPAEYIYRNVAKPFFIAPGAIELSEVIEIPPARTLVDWAMQPIGLEPILLIWGRADYRDVFGKSHFVEWCYRLIFSRPKPPDRMSASFIQWGDYNRSDEDKRE